MNTWFLAKYNWKRITDHCLNTFPQNYMGLGGDIWPECKEYSTECSKVYGEIQKSRTSLILDNELYIYVCTDLFLAKKYCQLLEHSYAIKPFLLKVQQGYTSDSDGYDFGNPEGGFSIIETEVLLKENVDISKIFLNEFGLFSTEVLGYNFLSSLDSSNVEELDDYRMFSIKNIPY